MAKTMIDNQTKLTVLYTAQRIDKKAIVDDCLWNNRNRLSKPDIARSILHLTASNLIVRALYDFIARQDDEVSFNKGDRMEVTDKGLVSLILNSHQASLHSVTVTFVRVHCLHMVDAK
jgi:SH3 domain